MPTPPTPPTQPHSYVCSRLQDPSPPHLTTLPQRERERERLSLFFNIQRPHIFSYSVESHHHLPKSISHSLFTHSHPLPTPIHTYLPRAPSLQRDHFSQRAISHNLPTYIYTTTTPKIIICPSRTYKYPLPTPSHHRGPLQNKHTPLPQNDPQMTLKRSHPFKITPKRLLLTFVNKCYASEHLCIDATPPQHHRISPTYHPPPHPTSTTASPPHVLSSSPTISRNLPATTDAKMRRAHAQTAKFHQSYPLPTPYNPQTPSPPAHHHPATTAHHDPTHFHPTRTPPEPPS